MVAESATAAMEATTRTATQIDIASFLPSTKTFEKHFRDHLPHSSSADAADGRTTDAVGRKWILGLAPARGATKAAARRRVFEETGPVAAEAAGARWSEGTHGPLLARVDVLGCSSQTFSSNLNFCYIVSNFSATYTS